MLCTPVEQAAEYLPAAPPDFTSVDGKTFMIFSNKLQTVRVPRPSRSIQITNHLSSIAAEITLPDILPSLSFYPDLHPFLTLVCSSASTFQTPQDPSGGV